MNNTHFENDLIIGRMRRHCSENIIDRSVISVYDTSEANYSSLQGKHLITDKDIGPIGNSKNSGFFLHPSLVFDEDTGFPLGISDYHIWNREHYPDDLSSYEKAFRPFSEKESYRWYESMQRSKDVLKLAKRVTYVGPVPRSE